MKKNIHWIVLAASICFSVSFVIVSILFQKETEPKLSLEKQVTNEVERISEGPGSFHGNVSQFNTEVGEGLSRRTNGVSNIPTDNITPPESSEQDIPEEESNATTREGEEDGEFMRWYQQAYQEALERYTVRIKDSLARIEPLFDEMDFYEAQLEPLKIRERWEEYTKTRNLCQKLTHELLAIYVFLRKEQLKELLGHLYLSTPQYAKLKVFAEDWHAKNPPRPARRYK